ncbi:MAG: DUF4178 domain-containing protein [Aquabacterium sp.]
MSDQTPQRVWRSTCSFCGAPVEFQSAASPMAVCSFCRSTLVRDGDTLRRIGQMAELFDDHSPLRLGTRGRYQGEPFSLIGRTQYAYKDHEGHEGRWTEWHALFDSGRSGCLSEDNGAYVFSFPLPAGMEALPDLTQRYIGDSVVLAERSWSLTARMDARVRAVEGELDRRVDPKAWHRIAELRNTSGEVLSIDVDEAPPSLHVGLAVELPDLALSGAADDKEASEARLQGRGIECPNCGAAVTPKLDNTQSIVCTQCHSVIDISRGLGRDLSCYRQHNGLEPLIPLGTTGLLAVAGKVDRWQVVGYMERCEVDVGEDEPQSFWREYLLYNKARGFAFLVDAEDGWSVVRPITGVPKAEATGVMLDGVRYRQRYTYNAKTTYVLGEFYWPVRQGQRSDHIDFISTGSPARLLNREQTADEVTWSQGQTLTASEVQAAFRIQPERAPAFARDSSPVSGATSLFKADAIVWLVVLIVFVMFIMESCSDDDCSDVRDRYGESSNEYQQCQRNRHSSGGSRSSGSSWGGYNSGGYHK